MNRIASLCVSFALICVMASAALAAAQATTQPVGDDSLKLPAIFADGMVLQREMPIPVWGWAKAGDKVTVTLGGEGAGKIDLNSSGPQIGSLLLSAAATADANGVWMAKLPAQKAGGPFTLTVAVAGGSTIELHDVLIGEVWICSGQSNMEMTVGQSLNADQEAAEANYPMIREFKIPPLTTLRPQDDVPGKWTTCSPATVKGFTAAGYFFARKIHQELGVPVGLINNSWGGKQIEPFTPREALAAEPTLAARLADVDAALKAPPIDKAEFDAKVAANLKAIEEVKKVEADENAIKKMADPALETADWKEMKLPQDWKKTDLGDYDGVVWFRKVVDIPADWAGHELILQLSPVDETDVTLFNGVEVGRTGSVAKNDYLKYWNVARTYKVPASAVKGGKTVLAVRVINLAYAAGLWSEKPCEMLLLPSDISDAKPITLNGAWKYKPILQIPAAPVKPGVIILPTTLWNAMVRPLVPFAIRGVLWYQGEANLSDGFPLYTLKMQTLVSGWRKAWGQGDFPFYYVQLAPFTYGQGSTALPRQWEAQTAALSIPNSGMACTVDIGDPVNIHPKHKQEVGDRLARWALAKTYGQDKLVYSGPMFKSVEFKDGKAIVKFDHVHGGLASRDDKDLTWFTILGEDSPTTMPAAAPGAQQAPVAVKLFVPAQAKIDGDTVVVWSDHITKPTAVRFAWDQVASPNLMNKEGLPAVPFRTDTDPK